MTDKDLPLSGHLTELRRRILICAVPFVILFFSCFYASRTFLSGVFRTCTDNGCSLFLMGVTDALMLRIRSALLLTILLLLPLITAETLLFVFPGLYRRERIIVLTLGAVCGLSFSAGAWFFITRLSSWLMRLWLEGEEGLPAQLSAVKFYDLWLCALIVCGAAACLPAAALFYAVLRITKKK